MRTAGRGALVAIVVLLLVAGGGVVAVEVLRGRLESSDELRRSLEAAVAAQLGAVLSPGQIAVALRPAALHLESPVVRFGEELVLHLPETRIDLTLESLVAGQPRLEGIELEGPARVVRGPLELGLVLEARLEPDPRGGWALEAEAQLGGGGSGLFRGTLSSDGRFVGELRLDDVNGEPFGPWLAGDPAAPPELAGLYSGKVELGGDAQPTLRLQSAEARIRLSPVVLEGPVALVAVLPGSEESGALAGRFAIDASRARVEYADGLIGYGATTRASGRGASVEGRIVRGVDGRLRPEEVALKIQGFRGERRSDGGPRRSDDGG